MAKKRVHEIAKAQGLTTKELLAALNAAGIEAKAAASSVDEELALSAIAPNGAGARRRQDRPGSPSAPAAAAKAAPRKQPAAAERPTAAAVEAPAQAAPTTEPRAGSLTRSSSPRPGSSRAPARPTARDRRATRAPASSDRAPSGRADAGAS